jgi:hypothetical protein
MTDQQTNQDRQANREAMGEKRTARQAYRTPSLVEYGSVAKLTQGTLTVGNDGPGGGMMNMACL